MIGCDDYYCDGSMARLRWRRLRCFLRLFSKLHHMNHTIAIQKVVRQPQIATSFRVDSAPGAPTPCTGPDITIFGSNVETHLLPIAHALNEAVAVVHGTDNLPGHVRSIQMGERTTPTKICLQITFALNPEYMNLTKVSTKWNF